MSPNSSHPDDDASFDLSDLLGEDQDVRDALAQLLGDDAANFLADDAALATAGDDVTGVQALEDVLADTDAGDADAAAWTPASGRLKQRRSSEYVKHVVFSMDGLAYAVPMTHVLEIQRAPGVTTIPHTPPWVLGVTNLRGEIVSVVDLRLFLGLERREQAELERLIVLRSLQDDMHVGVLVDRVLGIRQWTASAVSQPTAEFVDSAAEYTHGVVEQGNDLVSVLDCERLLSADALRQFEAV